LELSDEYGYKADGFAVFTKRPEIEGVEKRKWTIRQKDGDKKNILLTVSVMRDGNEGIIGYLGMVS